MCCNRDVGVRGRDGQSGVQGRAEADQDGLSRQPDRRAGVRRLPAANRLGEENSGIRVVMSGLDLERAVIAPICLGICERALELTIDHAKTRRQFCQPIANFQMVRAKIADMYVWVETLRGFTYQVLARCSELAHGEAGRGEIHALTAASVLYAAETVNGGRHEILNETNRDQVVGDLASWMADVTG